jgi:hypothetical protein
MILQVRTFRSSYVSSDILTSLALQFQACSPIESRSKILFSLCSPDYTILFFQLIDFLFYCGFIISA